MKYEYYNPSLERGGCISRAISKALKINYSDVKNDLIKLSIKLKKDDYHDIEVFDVYLNKNGFKTKSRNKNENFKYKEKDIRKKKDNKVNNSRIQNGKNKRSGKRK